jgi:hypothetical protein
MVVARRGKEVPRAYTGIVPKVGRLGFLTVSVIIHRRFYR